MSATNFFVNFNKILYNDRVATNIMNRAKISDLGVITTSKIYFPYLVKEGERPEDIAEEYYGSTSYFWLILLTNNVRNIYEDWPKTNDVLNLYIEEKYGSVEYALRTVHHYEDSLGNYINASIDVVEQDPNIDYWDGTENKKISIYEYEVDINDKKRIINLIRSDYKQQILKEFQNIFKK